MIIRRSTPADAKAIGEIYASARQYMIENGNPNQWNKGTPNEETALNDSRIGIGYVCEHDGEIVAAFAFCVGREPFYDAIFDGAWLNGEEYAYIHRVAVKKHGAGIIDYCLSECFKMHQNLKIDTHRDNVPMQRVLKRNGFVECGKVYIEDGDERIAFQKWGCLIKNSTKSMPKQKMR